MPADSYRAVMSIDVEDWFHVENLRSAIPRTSWDAQQSRVAQNTRRMLEMLARHNVRCTFFVLGWVAERYPDLVREMDAAGHEVASHGYGHELVYRLTPDEFRHDLIRSRTLIEEITGKPVLGYRAPSFSITDWAVDILQDEGLKYDSSLFPTVAHDRYGKLQSAQSNAPIQQIRPHLLEVSISSWTFGHSMAVPWGGGGYFRLIPFWLFCRGVGSILRDKKTYVFYIHPWEIDPGQPRIRSIGMSKRMRHYLNLGRCSQRWDSLLTRFSWSPIEDLLSNSE